MFFWCFGVYLMMCGGNINADKWIFPMLDISQLATRSLFLKELQKERTVSYAIQIHQRRADFFY
jgi:hypothetical protein